MKTGYINASGFNLVAMVERNGVRLIGVVFGGKTSGSRDRHMMQIMDNQFKRVKTIGIRRANLPHPKPYQLLHPNEVKIRPYPSNQQNRKSRRPGQKIRRICRSQFGRFERF